MFALHYKPKKISEIKLKTDSRVSLIGRIIEVGDNSFVLSDETGRIEIISNSSVEEGRIVRVFCSVVENQLKADVVQSLEGIDLNLFKKVEELYKRVGV